MNSDYISAVVLHPDDNVMCLLRDHEQGETPLLKVADGVSPPVLRQATPLGHKIALRDIGKNKPVIKYGMPVALARSNIFAGDHAHLHNLKDPADAYAMGIADRGIPLAEADSRRVPAAHVSSSADPARKRLIPREFSGFPRLSGRPGIRNHLLILSVCGLNAAGARKVQTALPGSLLVSTAYGRGQLGADKIFHEQMLTRLACHPNVGGVIVLAADRCMRDRYQTSVTESGRACVGFSLQECEEDTVMLTELAVAAGSELQHQLDDTVRQPCAINSLAIAMECGHSDASSGMVSNPLCGMLADELIGAGGSVLFSETMEWSGSENDLYQRCQSNEVAERLKRLIAARQNIAKAVGVDLFLDNPGPQNHAGGITTLVEKSRGAIAKGGTCDITGGLEQGELLPMSTGLYLMDTPAFSPESISSMVASSAQLVLFTTGHGNPYGSAIAPTIKLSGNPQTVQHVSHQIDFDASTAFDGRQSLTDMLPALCELAVRVCEGESVAVERLDEGGEAISRLSASV